MPLYLFENTETGEREEVFMKASDVSNYGEPVFLTQVGDTRYWKPIHGGEVLPTYDDEDLSGKTGVYRRVFADKPPLSRMNMRRISPL